MSIPYDEESTEDTTVGATDLDETQDDTTLDDPTMNDDAVRETFLEPEDEDSTPEEWEDMPAADAQALDADQPGTQNEDSAVEAELGIDGQGDLAPEDEQDAGLHDDGPDDLRTEL